MRKKILALALVTVMAVMSGCGSTSTGSVSETVAGNGSEAAGENSADALSGVSTPVTEVLMTEAMQDLEGNEVHLSDIFAENKVTMVNAWGTFCDPCKEEMPYLAELEKKYKDQGFEIVGLTIDVVDSDGNVQEEEFNDCKEIVGSSGVEYPVVLMNMSLLEKMDLFTFPTTYFINSKGEMVGKPVVGGHSEEDWEKIITGYIG
ncbi:MAG: redoxin family protein [Lachnospiraceae bacterium]|nr:redoxin family protein [Lachnospiraceae bacterium]